METFFDPFLIVILFTTQLVKYSASLGEQGDCPSDCICYPDYLTNLDSWKWIETNIHSNSDDPEHEEFNPYTEHNEVYDNPNVAKNLREEPLRTVTCILRTDFGFGLAKLFDKIPSNTQVLSLLQAAGSGNITIGKRHFENLKSIIGLEIQGYSKKDNNLGQDAPVFRLEADAFVPLHKLAYLNLENVVIQQRSLQNNAAEYTSQIVKITRVASHNSNDTSDRADDDIMNELESQLMFLSPNGQREEAIIIPYNQYKNELSEQRSKHPFPIQPKIAVAFTNLPSLIHLRISQCNMEDMSWDMFYKLFNLKHLLLEKNDLLFLPDFVFYSTSNLTALSLSGNRILSLQTVGLAGLLHLQKLDMTNNNITHLSELSLPPFPNLEVADFRLNPIETIFPNTFEVMNTTKTLYLGSPDVSLIFFPNSFFGLVALTKLDIANVRIGFLEKPMLKGLPQLKHLVMTGLIKRVSFDAFNEVPKLEKLFLKNCGIEKISMDAFYGLTALMELDLSHNKLTFLPPGIFEDQVSLREIYLQFNKLTTLGRHLFSSTPAKLIRLEGNPWHCSCELNSWDPYVVNQVKRYHIPRNPVSSFCQVQYDKGIMCNREYTGFKVKYVYEKRVSPLCETPSKFSKRSVFEVVRKEFRYCEEPPNTLEVPEGKIKKKSDQTQTIQLPNANTEKSKKKKTKYEIVKTAEQVEKEQEKRLLIHPEKIRKPERGHERNPNINPSIDIPKHIQDEVNALSIIQAHLNLPSSTPLTSSLDIEAAKLAEIIGILPATPVLSETTIPSEPTTPPPTPIDGNELPNNILTQPDPFKFAQQSRIGLENVKQKQTKQLGLASKSSRLQPISKKALKLAKLERMERMMKQRKP